MGTGRIPGVVLVLVTVAGLSRDARADIPYPDLATPGELRGIARDPEQAWNMGYWEYLPANFADASSDHRWPMLVFLGGIGQSDETGQCPNGAPVCAESDCNFEELCRATRRGPMRLMHDGTWDDTERPYIFVSPQHAVPGFSTQAWSIDDLDEFFDYVVANYPIDERRMYLVGMSKGGRAVLQYGAAHPRRFTAIVPSPGGAVADDVTCGFQDTAIWAFHGEDDANANLGTGVFDPCWMARRIHMYDHPEAYPQYERCLDRAAETFPPGRITMFYDVGHESWIPANDPLGFGFATDTWTEAEDCFGIDLDYRPYRPDLDPDGVYSWFESLDRPRVAAPDDLSVAQEIVALTAAVLDDDPVEFAWTQTEGPSAALSGTTESTLLIEGLQPDTTYRFAVLAVDGDGQWAQDDVRLMTDHELAEGTTTTASGELPTTSGDDSGTTGGGGDASGGADDGSSTGGADTSATTIGATGTMTETMTGTTTTALTDGPSPMSGEQDDASTTATASCTCKASATPPAWWAIGWVLLGWRRRRACDAKTPRCAVSPVYERQ